MPHPRFILFGQFEVAEVDRDGDIDRLNPLHLVSLQRLTDRNGPGAKKRGRLTLALADSISPSSGLVALDRVFAAPFHPKICACSPPLSAGASQLA